MEARTYAHTHIVLAKVQYEENRPAHLVLHNMKDTSVPARLKTWGTKKHEKEEAAGAGAGAQRGKRPPARSHTRSAAPPPPRAAGPAPAPDPPERQRVLVLADRLSVRNTHSLFLRGLERHGLDLDVRLASDKSLQLREWDAFYYDKLVLFAGGGHRSGASLQRWPSAQC